MNTREEQLDALLRPITWSWSSSIRARQNHVCNRRAEVAITMPFLNPDELVRAEEWLGAERHEGLWD